METKRDRFVRLAEARTNKTIEMIRLIGNLATKNNYDYTDADVQKIFGAIEKELKAAKAKYVGSNTNDTFKL